MRVSLNPVRPPRPGNAPGTGAERPLLAGSGARAILGQPLGSASLAEPIVASSRSLFGPRGVALALRNGPLFVADTGHHRVLAWKELPRDDHAPAEIVIGQPDFTSEGRNGRSPIGPATLNVPTGIAASNGILAVADAWNHRVLVWHGFPTRSCQPADVVLGQADFDSGLANRGRPLPSGDTLNWCYSVTISRGALYVADTGNRRVLKWNSIPTRNGQPADLVLGQTTFDCRDENAGHAPDAMSMRWPHAVLDAGEALCVADAGNNRIMVWSPFPTENGTPAALMLGQATSLGVDHNQASYYPTASTLNMPYGLSRIDGAILAADTANSRIVAFDLASLATGAPASSLAGQRTFAEKGDNRWGPPQRDSLCWPYGLAAAGDTLAIADSGNNRVLIWEAAA